METKIRDKEWKYETRVIIKNKCVSCGESFKNSAKRFQKNGNYCSICSERISFKMEWFKLEGRKNLKREQQERFVLLTSALERKHHLNMRLEKKKHEEFLKRVRRMRV